MGPTATLKRLEIAGNTRISKGVESVVADELKAADAGIALYSKGIDVYKISVILSAGCMGIKKKLVPTRWSITAVDDIITKHMISRIKGYKSISDFMVFESCYLDNRFSVLMMPGSWEFENFEAWSPGSTWGHYLKKPEIVEEYEPFGGRKTYAEKQAGGYYASRLAAAEYLHRIRRQARVVVFREIYEGYMVPLGAWVVRQTARDA